MYSTVGIPCLFGGRMSIADVFVPDLWVLVNEAVEQLMTIGRIQVDHLDTPLPQPVYAALECP